MNLESMKELLKLEGVKAFSKIEQKLVFGGYSPPRCISCTSNSTCSPGICIHYSGDCAQLACGCGSYCS
jgi:hypothetical protein